MSLERLPQQSKAASSSLGEPVFGLAAVLTEAADATSDALRERKLLQSIVGDTRAIRAIREHVEKLARYQVSVLLVGEPGSGKGLVARLLHDLTLPTLPFVRVRCASGHVSGRLSAELAEVANGGTVYLDELDDAPDALWNELHVWLDNRPAPEAPHPEGTLPRVRVIGASSRAQVADVSLRPDLLATIAGFTLWLPPLRERQSDIALLAREFLAIFSRGHAQSPKTFSKRALTTLQKAAWPGNVRQLRAVVEAAAILAPGTTVDREVIEECLLRVPRFERRKSSTPPSHPLPLSSATPPSGSTFPSLRDMERALIVAAWTDHRNNLTRAANHLGIPRSTLRDKLRKYGLV